MSRESSIALIDLIKEDLPIIRTVDADIKLMASRLVMQGRGSILSNQAHEILPVTIEQQFDGDHQACGLAFRHR